MNIEIRKVRDIDLNKIFKIRSSYIDATYKQFTEIAEMNLELWFVAYDQDKLIGYCLGNKDEGDPNYIILDEIVTNLSSNIKYKRKGIGSKLIKEFEKEVWRLGYKVIGFGCSDKYEVEQFYLKNEYIPIEVVARAKGVELERIKITDYETGKLIQEKLHSKYDVEEVNFIFEKYNINE